MTTSKAQFEPFQRWTNDDHTLTPRAQGYLQGLFSFTGADTGTVPITSLGADGVSSPNFLDATGDFRLPDYPVAADPTGLVGLTAVNGTAATFLRSDAAPQLNLAITPTWTGAHTFQAAVTTTSSVTVGTGFGCNSKSAQTAATVNAAVAGTAGAAYTATEQGMINDLKALVNQIRTALVANGICV